MISFITFDFLITIIDWILFLWFGLIAIDFFKEATNVFYQSHSQHQQKDSDFSDASL